ncbi:hypothetical protein HDV63DRAFT_60232 [Trichoderma sp. SZMC 28014]
MARYFFFFFIAFSYGAASRIHKNGTDMMKDTRGPSRRKNHKTVARINGHFEREIPISAFRPKIRRRKVMRFLQFFSLFSESIKQKIRRKTEQRPHSIHTLVFSVREMSVRAMIRASIFPILRFFCLFSILERRRSFVVFLECSYA